MPLHALQSIAEEEKAAPGAKPRSRIRVLLAEDHHH